MSFQPEAYEGKAPYIFISYAHKNAEAVLPAIRALKDAGYPVWYDGGIQVGTEWPEYIAEHLLHSALVISFISEASIASQNCRQEIVYALDKRKPMIAVHLEEVHLPPGMEMQLNLCQALLAYKHVNREGYINELVRAPYIAEVLGRKEVPPAQGETQGAKTGAASGNASGTASGGASGGASFAQNTGTSQSGSSPKLIDRIKKIFDTKDESSAFGKEDIEKNKVMAILAYFGLLVLIPIFAAKDSPYARYHANQGLLFTLFSAAVSVAGSLLTVLTAGLFGILLPLVGVAMFAVFVFMLCNVSAGRAKELPFVGHFRIIK